MDKRSSRSMRYVAENGFTVDISSREVLEIMKLVDRIIPIAKRDILQILPETERVNLETLIVEAAVYRLSGEDKKCDQPDPKDVLIATFSQLTGIPAERVIDEAFKLFESSVRDGQNKDRGGMSR